jgi:dephospho-CoA kinase
MAEHVNIPKWRVGITGGIGSGKSTVCRLFETLGIPVYDADYWAKWLLGNDPELIEGVKSIFGEAAYLDGAYNRSYISKVVFEDAEKLAALNAIAHPAVERHATAWHQQQKAPYTLKEAALMIESGSYRHLDYLIVVTAPEAIRIQRVMARDQSTEEAVRRRISHQWPEEKKVALADFVINNDGHHALIPQVWKIHQALSAP